MGATTQDTTSLASAGAPPIGTSACGSRGLLVLTGVAWLAWIGFLVFVLMARA